LFGGVASRPTSSKESKERENCIWEEVRGEAVLPQTVQLKLPSVSKGMVPDIKRNTD
jgi:hypothetical protein